MKHITLTIQYLLFPIFFYVTGSVTQGESSEAILKRMEAKMDGLTDFSASFVQRISYSLSGKKKSFEGRFYLKRPVKFRVETEDCAFVSDGDTLWAYSARNQQVTIYQADSAPPSLNPYSTLLDFREEYEVDTLIVRTMSSKRIIYLQLHPRAEGYIKLLEIWCDEEDLLPRRLRYVDNGDNLMDFEFKEITFDEGVNDSLFIYRPPEGIEVVDMRRKYEE